MNDSTSKKRYSWRPLSLSILFSDFNISNRKVLLPLLGWALLICASMAILNLLMPVNRLTNGGDKMQLTQFFIINPPFIIGLLLLFWAGFEWGFVPVFISSFVLAFLSGLGAVWSLLFGFSFIFGLALYGLAYQSLRVPHDLRGFSSIVFFVAVSFVAALASSIGAFIWSLAHHLSVFNTAVIWKSWWTGVFFQAILITGPLLFAFTPRVEELKLRHYQIKESRTPSLKWIYGTIITITGVLVIFIFSGQLLGKFRINEVLDRLPDIVRGDVTGALGDFEIIIWLSVGLIAVTGYTAIYLVDRWNRQLRDKVKKRTAQYRKTEKELQKALAEKKLLLKETHHRVKNNLAQVHALLQLQMMNVDDERYSRLIENSSTRIQSMSLIHQTLYETEDYAHIPLDVYFQRLASIIHKSFARSDKEINLKLELENHRVSAKQAVPLGLIMTEILINAHKYAFDGKNSGVISIALQPQAGRLLLTIGDDGMGLPVGALKKKNSLGMELIQQLSAQINGKLSIHSSPQGTRFSLLFTPAKV